MHGGIPAYRHQFIGATLGIEPRLPERRTGRLWRLRWGYLGRPCPDASALRNSERFQHRANVPARPARRRRLDEIAADQRKGGRANRLAGSPAGRARCVVHAAAARLANGPARDPLVTLGAYARVPRGNAVAAPRGVSTCRAATGPLGVAAVDVPRVKERGRPGAELAHCPGNVGHVEGARRRSSAPAVPGSCSPHQSASFVLGQPWRGWGDQRRQLPVRMMAGSACSSSQTSVSSRKFQ